MRRSINSTGRKRIEGGHVAVTLAASPPPRIGARFSLDALALPATARIVLEAHRGDLTERFAFGTVGAPGPEADPRLHDLPPDGVLFRVKVVEPETGRLLARGDGFRAGAGEAPRRHELLRVRGKDLGQELWKVELPEGDAPTLYLNNRDGQWASRLGAPALRAAVLPSAMRAVLVGYWLRGEDLDNDGDPDSWPQRWLRLAADLAGGEEWPDEDESQERMAWIDRACVAFAERYKLLDAMLAADGGAQP